MPSNVVTALEVSGQIASAIPFNAVGLQGIFGAAKAIAELLDAVRSDRLACQVLSGKASRLVAHVSKIVERQADGAVSEDFQGSIEDLEKSMNEVTAKLAKIVDSKLWRRVFHRRRNSETLKECTSLLDEAWRKFDTTALLLIQRIQCDILSRQAYDETHRIFRLCELRLYEVPHAEPDAIYEQAVGEIVDPHRCVLVRRMKPGVDVELFWKEVDQLKDIWEPDKGMVVGYSERWCKQPFYVFVPPQPTTPRMAVTAGGASGEVEQIGESSGQICAEATDDVAMVRSCPSSDMARIESS